MIVNVPDIMSTLLSKWKEKAPTARDLAELQADCFLVIVAGRLASSLDYSLQLPLKHLGLHVACVAVTPHQPH